MFERVELAASGVPYPSVSPEGEDGVEAVDPVEPVPVPVAVRGYVVPVLVDPVPVLVLVFDVPVVPVLPVVPVDPVVPLPRTVETPGIWLTISRRRSTVPAPVLVPGVPELPVTTDVVVVDTVRVLFALSGEFGSVVASGFEVFATKSFGAGIVWDSALMSSCVAIGECSAAAASTGT